MIVTAAEFIKSAVKPKDYPPAERPEIAFAGRSNVGKSSLINALLNRKRLVKTSSTPGRTQLLNFFVVNGRFNFVDLPGFGYAKVPMAVKKQWRPMVETYLAERATLRGVVVIMDIRRTPGVEEPDLFLWLERRGIPSVRVLTKTDKLSKNQQINRKKQIAGNLALPHETLILFSAKTRQGRDELWKALTPLLEPAV